MPSVDIESMKHAAKRPKPPLPRDGSGSISSISLIDFPAAANSAFTSL